MQWGSEGCSGAVRKRVREGEQWSSEGEEEQWGSERGGGGGAVRERRGGGCITGHEEEEQRCHNNGCPHHRYNSPLCLRLAHHIAAAGVVSWEHHNPVAVA